ncbi:MAG: 50S ribosomal protein L13 [Deltaproteobacteria bacterium]|nr:50S ribosomal protein L13 [Deltaproteobacteria bacterium]
MKTTKFINATQFGNNKEYQKQWYQVDADGKTLGRLSSQIAKILQGKHKPIYTPNTDTGDFVVVVNAEKIKMTGDKLDSKFYYHHTGYPGGLKSAKAGDLLEKNPELLIINAVKRMMPKNQLNRDGFRKLKVYAGPEHPHQANKPQPLDI